MKTQPPRRIDDISADWLTQGLRARGFLQESSVVDFGLTRIGKGLGFLSCIGRLALDYDHREQRAPDSVVVKIASDSAAFRSIGDELHAFEREIRFYQDVAERIPAGLPCLYFAVTEAPDYAIVMEDLTDYIAGDQIAGMHNAQVLATSRLLAGIQAHFWDNSALDSLSWMPDDNGIVSQFSQYWPAFVQQLGDLIGADGVQVGEQAASNIHWLQAQMRCAPRTIVHSDLRADNLLFGADNSENAVKILDWQLAVRSMGAFDIARLLGGSEPPGERRGHQFETLRAWYGALLERGVEHYSWDDAIYHFRIGALCCLAYPVKFHGEVSSVGGRGATLVKTIAKRMFMDAVEIDALSVLP